MALSLEFCILVYLLVGLLQAGLRVVLQGKIQHVLRVGINALSHFGSSLRACLDSSHYDGSQVSCRSPNKIRIQHRAITSPHSLSQVRNLALRPSGFRIPGLSLAKL